jgi:hypothetical protein
MDSAYRRGMPAAVRTRGFKQLSSELLAGWRRSPRGKSVSGWGHWRQRILEKCGGFCSITLVGERRTRLAPPIPITVRQFLHLELVCYSAALRKERQRARSSDDYPFASLGCPRIGCDPVAYAAESFGTSAGRGPQPGRKRKMSLEARARIAAAQKARWAKQKVGK